MARRDEDDDISRRRRKKRKSKASAANTRLPLLLGVGGGVVVLLGLAAVALVLLLSPRPPEEDPRAAFDDFQDAVAAGDHGRVYDRLHPDGLDTHAMQIQLACLTEPEMKKHSNKRGRDLWVAYYQERDRTSYPHTDLLARWRKKATVEAVSVDGDTATLTLRTHDGTTESVRMRKLNDSWRYRPTWFAP